MKSALTWDIRRTFHVLSSFLFHRHKRGVELYMYMYMSHVTYVVYMSRLHVYTSFTCDMSHSIYRGVADIRGGSKQRHNTPRPQHCIHVYTCTYVHIQNMYTYTGWRGHKRCRKLQVIFRKRVTNYRALLRKTT